MNTCPNCSQRLLSHTSAKCNWCGAVIDDAAYQAEADEKREEFFEEQAVHDAASLQAIKSIVEYDVLVPGVTTRRQRSVSKNAKKIITP